MKNSNNHYTYLLPAWIIYIPVYPMRQSYNCDIKGVATKIRIILHSHSTGVTYP